MQFVNLTQEQSIIQTYGSFLTMDMTPIWFRFLVSFYQQKRRAIQKTQGPVWQEDQLDIAIWELHQVTVNLLTNKSFLNRKGISITADQTKGVYYLAGFPCEWSITNTSEQRFDMKAIRYISHPYEDTKLLTDFDPRLHMALTYDPSPPTPESLEGISGCSIWKLGDIPQNDGWTSNDAKVVAVQTCVHRKGKAVQGTMWRWVVQMLVRLRPEIRPALNVWLPGPE
jgi:hypothetical protein